MEVVVTTGAISSSQIVTTNKPTPNFLQVGCPSCHPTNSVKALKGLLHIIKFNGDHKAAAISSTMMIWTSLLVLQ